MDLKYLANLKIAEYLIGGSVFLKSVEIHSRCAKGTPIPPHQDNAYYGLKNAKALTFYIPINNEFADMGGLKYFKNPNTYELEHKPSDASTIISSLCKLSRIYISGLFTTILVFSRL